MTSLQKRTSPSRAAPPQQGSIESKGKVVGSQESPDDTPIPPITEPTQQRGAPSHRDVSESDLISPLNGPSHRSRESEKRTEKRLSQVVPKREPGRELVNEEKPWDVKNILSFDGGGIRGLYSLLMLKQLMEQIRFFEDVYSNGEGKSVPAKSSFHPTKQPLNVSHKPSCSQKENDQENVSEGFFLPCHYFDYICGSSTGGLIAIMLGRLRMTVDDCIQEYEQLAGDIFGHANIFHQTFLPTAWMKRPKYSTQVVEGVIRGLINRRGEGTTDDARRILKTGSELCRVFVFAYRRDDDDTKRTQAAWEQPYIFRSYDHYKKSPSVRNPGTASEHHLWQVARATTAAPLYFAPMQVYLDDEIPEPKPGLLKRLTSNFNPKQPSKNTSRPVTFLDGGFGPANNPSREAWQEVSSSNEKVGIFVSIGTARGKTNRFHTALRPFIKAGIAAVGDPEPPHHDMETKSKEQKFDYYRFNEFDGLPDLDFDEWKPSKNGKHTQDKIHKAYQKLICKPEVQESFRRCALDLVRRRRLRTADESRWERYATKVYFDCGEDKCPEEAGKRWYDRNEFREHLMTSHRLTEDGSLATAIQRDGKSWRYRAPGNGASI